MSEIEQIILPERFKRVDYLFFDKNQYINTGVYISNSIGAKLKYTRTFPFGDGDYYAKNLLGCRAAANGNPNCWVPPNALAADGTFYCHFGTNDSYKPNLDWKLELGKVYEVEHNFKNCSKSFINGEFFVEFDREQFTENNYTKFPLHLGTFVLDNGVYNAYNWYGRCYYCIITDGEDYIRHFIPVYDTYNLEACMYELVEGKAYYNNGTGSFGWGKDDEQLGVLHKLPEGFTKVDYLISNGSQWIDTNYIPTNETGYYIECQTYLANNNSRAVFGLFESDETSTRNRIYLYLNPYPSVGWNKTTQTLTNQTSWQKEELKCEFNFLNSRTVSVKAKDLTLTHVLTDLSFTPTVPIYLFNSYGNTNADGRIKGQINTFIISEGDKIVRQFVPCLDADNVPCMYEIYEGTAYYNQGEGQFSYPQVYINHEYNLPANYKRCAYLQSNGTQYINTGHAANDETGLYLKAQQLSYGDFVPFGASEDTSLYLYAPRINKNLIAYAWTTYITGFTWDKGDDLIFTSTLNLYNDRTVRFDSLDSDFTALLDNTLGQMTQPLGLFSWNAKGSFNTSSGTWGGRIYRAKITQGSALIHDYIPCLDGDNRPCMWDAITGETKYNQSGGEEFEYCLEHQLPSDFVKLEYIESTGTQFIKTSYVPTNTTGLYIDTQDIGSGDTIPMGLRESSSTDTRFFVTRQTASANTGYGWGAWTEISTTKGSVRYDSTLNWLNDRKSITNNPLFVTVIKNLGELSFTPTLDIWMFGINQGGNHAYKFKGRIYRAKISEGSEIVRDYVPAYDQKKYKPCMYDLINNVAYYNDGTGEFKYDNRAEGSYTGYTGLGCIGNRLGGYYPQT